jgi:hypothetical protein
MKKQKMDHNSLDTRTEFSIDLNKTIKRELVLAYMKKSKVHKFVLYRMIGTNCIVNWKYSSMDRGKIFFQLRLSFVVLQADLDGKPVYLIRSVTGKLYDWQVKTHTKFTIENAALIQKIIRLLSIHNKEAADAELYKLIVQPFNHNIPLRFMSPQLLRENSFSSSIYFDELLVCLYSGNSLSLTLHRFERKEQVYHLLPGTVSGLAKQLETAVDYNKQNSLDLTAIPQELLKYNLLTTHRSREDDISRLHNVSSLRHEVRRQILGLGICDVRFDIYLATFAANPTRQSPIQGDIDISGATSELFFSAISTRIISMMAYELTRPGISGIVNLNEMLSNNPFRGQKFDDMKLNVSNVKSHQKAQKSPKSGLRSKLGALKDSRSGNEAAPKFMSFLQRQEDTKKPESMSQVVSKTNFLHKLLRMKAEGREKGRGSILISKKQSLSPKLFWEHEAVLFKLSLFPTNSRTLMHKITLSSADISAIFNISDFLVEGMGLGKLDVKSIAWISGLDAKIIFNYFCTFIANRIMMKRWVIFKRPFIFFSKDISRQMYLHQNNVIRAEQKVTPKLVPFLRVQSFGVEYLYHRVVRLDGSFMVVSILKDQIDQIYIFKLYSQKSCRSYTCNFNASDLANAVEDFLSGLFHYVLSTHPSKLQTRLSELLTTNRRTLKPKIGSFLELSSEASFESSVTGLAIRHFKRVLGSRGSLDPSPKNFGTEIPNEIKEVKRVTGAGLLSRC